MVVDGDNVDCCEKMSHECPTGAWRVKGRWQELMRVKIQRACPKLSVLIDNYKRFGT